jgi:hypothetical protein
MAYLTRDELKLYLGIAGDSEHPILDALLVAAQAAIDAYCDRTFEAGADTTRTLDAQAQADGRVLYLDADLCQITSITNGDDAATVLAPAVYVTLPRNDTPVMALRLRDDYSGQWEGEIAISGRWAYSLTAPESVVQATREYTAYLYRLYDRQADPDQTPDAGIPAHVRQLLEGYRRLR